MKKFWQRLILFGLTGAFFVSCISCSAANTASKVPILMYHNLTNDPSAVTSMTITGERFQEDMEYLEYNGYTPLLSADLINIRAGKESMPERPVMITFDDGYRSNYDIAYPILQKTGMKAVIALIGKSIRANDNTEANRFFLKWDEAAEMADSGLVELASHTYNLHNPQYGGLTAPDGINGIQRLKGESQAAYNKRVGEDLKQSIDLITQNTNQKKKRAVFRISVRRARRVDAAAAAEKRYSGQRTDQHRNGVYPAQIDRSAALPHHDGHQAERYSSGEPERLARYYRAGAHADHDQE